MLVIGYIMPSSVLYQSKINAKSRNVGPGCRVQCQCRDGQYHFGTLAQEASALLQMDQFPRHRNIFDSYWQVIKLHQQSSPEIVYAVGFDHGVL